jgi:hypothetical protein
VAQPSLGLERRDDRDDATVEGPPAGSGRGTQQWRRDPMTLRRVWKDGRRLADSRWRILGAGRRSLSGYCRRWKERERKEPNAFWYFIILDI